MTDFVDTQSVSRELALLLPELDVQFVRPYLLMARETMPDSQFRVLALLKKLPDSSMSRIAAELQISRPQATALVDTLVLHGYAERVSHTADRRHILIRTTPKADCFFEELNQRAQARLSQMLAALSPAEIRQLSDSVRELRGYLRRLYGTGGRDVREPAAASPDRPE